MKDMYVVSLVGPRDGKAQKGMATWLTFLHPDEIRAGQLGAAMAQRLTGRTGMTVRYHVEPVPCAHGDEMALLGAVDEVAQQYEAEPAGDRSIVIATFPADHAPTTVLAGRLVDEIREDHGIDLDDWLIVSEETSTEDEESEAAVALSLPSVDAERLMQSRSAVDRYALVLSDEDAPGSLYDDDARMEEIIADAEDAAAHAWGRAGAPVSRRNPHPEGSEEEELWDNTFFNAYARENGR